MMYKIYNVAWFHWCSIVPGEHGINYAAPYVCVDFVVYWNFRRINTYSVLLRHG